MIKYKLTDYQYSQNIFEVRGKSLYEFENIAIDQSMFFDKRCINFINCNLKHLEEELYTKHIAPLISVKNLSDVIKNENEVIKTYSKPLYGYYLYQTKNKYICIADTYHKIFCEWEEPIIFYKNDIVYFFEEMPDENNNYNGDLMFIGGVMTCQVTETLVKNIIEINKFYNTLPEISKDLIASEFDVKTFKPNGTITKPKGF